MKNKRKLNFTIFVPLIFAAIFCWCMLSCSVRDTNEGPTGPTGDITPGSATLILVGENYREVTDYYPPTDLENETLHLSAYLFYGSEKDFYDDNWTAIEAIKNATIHFWSSNSNVTFVPPYAKTNEDGISGTTDDGVAYSQGYSFIRGTQTIHAESTEYNAENSLEVYFSCRALPDSEYKGEYITLKGQYNTEYAYALGGPGNYIWETDNTGQEYLEIEALGDTSVCRVTLIANLFGDTSYSSSVTFHEANDPDCFATVNILILPEIVQ